MLHVRAAGGAAWRAGLSGQAGDVFRIDDQHDATVAVLANAFDYGFSTCWPQGYRRVLDLFCDEWAAAAGPVRERVLATFDRTRRLLAAEGHGLLPSVGTNADDPPAATLLVAAIDGTKVHAAWIGGDLAIHARGFRVVEESAPDTLRRRFAKEHPELTGELSAIPNALVRTIGPLVDQAPPGMLTFDVEAADSVVLLSKAPLQGSCVPSNEAAFAAAVHASPSTVVNRLTRLGVADGGSPYAAAIVFRFDAMDLGPIMDQLIAAYEPDPRHDRWLRAWAVQHRALPVAFDMGGAFGMMRDGSVISVGWEDRTTGEETSPLANAAAVIGAARNYKALEWLRPKRPPDAQACSNCASAASPRGEPEGCALCWYLGWLPPSPPKWFFGD